MQGVPDLYCIAVDDRRCASHRQHVTKYEIEADACRSIARDGIYNPFRKPLEQSTRPAPPERDEVHQEEGNGGAVVATGGDAGGYRHP